MLPMAFLLGVRAVVEMAVVLLQHSDAEILEGVCGLLINCAADAPTARRLADLGAVDRSP